MISTMGQEKEEIFTRESFYNRNYADYKETLAPVNHLLEVLGYRILAGKLGDDGVVFKLVRTEDLYSLCPRNENVYPCGNLVESTIKFLSGNSFYGLIPWNKISPEITFPSFSSLLELEMKLKIAGKIT